MITCANSQVWSPGFRILNYHLESQLFLNHPQTSYISLALIAGLQSLYPPHNPTTESLTIDPFMERLLPPHALILHLILILPLLLPPRYLLNLPVLLTLKKITPNTISTTSLVKASLLASHRPHPCPLRLILSPCLTNLPPLHLHLFNLAPVTITLALFQ